MRIVSLVPAATEILAEVGLGAELVGIGADSDYPADLAPLAHVTRAVPHQSGTSTARERLAAFTHGIAPGLAADPAAIAALAPDLVITQSRCRACGVAVRPVAGAPELQGISIVDLEATSIEGIFNAITTIGAMTESEDDAIDFVESLRARLGVVEEGVAERRFAGRPPHRVVVLQRLDPPATAGHWVPEQVRRAGGWEVLGEAGAASVETTWEAIAEVDPEFLLLAPADSRINVARPIWDRAPRPRLWQEISAVRSGQVFLLDGPPYFGRPAPRVIDGMELLAEVLDPDHFIETSPPGSWTPLYPS
jgi:iron complex transport system substrate-binding protein